MTTKVFFLLLLAAASTSLAPNSASIGQSVLPSNLFQLDHEKVTEQDQDKDKDSKESQPHDRMEDRGCCVLKKSKYKPEWDYSDDESRRLCVETARKSAFDYDFYKDQKCDDVKKNN